MKDYAIYESKFGEILIEYSNDSVYYLKFRRDGLEGDGIKTPFTDLVFRELEEYFDGKRKVFTFKYTLEGTDFQKKVWEALCTIPYGETRSYKEIASQVGNSKASRAVGMANNKNPISVAVPCHRVIGANGKLVGYAGGLDLKEQLLDLEKKNK